MNRPPAKRPPPITAPIAPSQSADTAIHAVVKKYWGYETLRPLQADAIRAGIVQRDSLVVLPTGGGKSLCYQVPPIVVDRTDVVVSPLISLMKDQVDGLRQCGYPAAALNSGMADEERRTTYREAMAGKYRLLFMAPERLMHDGFQDALARLNVRAFAIDEAHCISHWGHDFRPEYRRLSQLKHRFPGASIHAYTATATDRVRRDIVSQLGLRDPSILVGDFDRPNLTFRVIPRDDAYGQTREIIARHEREAVIVYCISRRNTEAMASYLLADGVKAAFYHAGMTPNDRRKTQDAFAREEIDVIVATVAFGMGIDRSNVRCVIHAAMPKSIEHYQQEAGRAGRDGLEAECIMLYSPGDAVRWQKLLSGDTRSDGGDANYRAQIELMQHLQSYCQPIGCRHRRLVEYFGQRYEKPRCDACDVCLDEVGDMVDATELAQKILSCVARAGERFGATHIAAVLRGGDTEMIRKWNHQSLSTYGLIPDLPMRELTATIGQLADLGYLTRSTDGFGTLSLNDASWEVMRGRRELRLPRAPQPVTRQSRGGEISWEGVDRGLFEALRQLRKSIADERGVPPFVIFGDASLREMARNRPHSEAGFRKLHGVGEAKLAEFGRQFVARIREYCAAHGLEENLSPPPSAPPRPPLRQCAGAAAAAKMFAAGASIEEVATALDRAPSTVAGYLNDYVRRERPASIAAWVNDAAYARVAAAARQSDSGRLKPIFEALGGEISYNEIRLVLSHVQTVADQSSPRA